MVLYIGNFQVMYYWKIFLKLEKNGEIQGITDDGFLYETYEPSEGRTQSKYFSTVHGWKFVIFSMEGIFTRF